jgi:hypothetical protein
VPGKKTIKRVEQAIGSWGSVEIRIRLGQNYLSG